MIFSINFEVVTKCTKCLTNKVLKLFESANNCSEAKCEEFEGEEMGRFPTVYSLRDCGEQSVPLDHNYTCFILADNGTVHKFGTEITLRAQLESYIRTKCPQRGKSNATSL